MKRRNFIKFTLISTFAISLNNSFARSMDTNTYLVLEEVFNILFPKTSSMPSAKEFKALDFLLKTLNHHSFESYDKELIITGTKDFHNTFSNFLTLNKKEKKELIFEIVNANEYAQTWLSKLVYYGIEALLGDPLYGGNINNIGWKSVSHYIPYPRPKKTYGQKI